MKRSEIVCGLALSLVGCHDTAVRPRAPSTVGEAARQPGLTPDGRPSRPRGEIPESQRLASVLRIEQADGALRLIAGPLRYEVRGGARSVADEVTPWPIAFAAKASRAWLFVTTHAQVYASPTFTGPLTALRAFGCDRDVAPTPVGRRSAGRVRGEATRPTRPAFEPPMVLPSHGRAVLRAPDGALYTSDGTSLDELSVADAVSAAWSGRRGVVLVALRTLRFTSDDGATWRDVELGGVTPLGVAGDETALYAYTSSGWREIDANGALAVSSRRPRFSHSPIFDMDPSNRLGPELQGAFTRAPAPAEQCPARRDSGSDWSAPRFVALMPVRRGEIIAPPWRPAPLGTPRGRAFADTSAVPAVVSVTRPDHPQPGHAVTLLWRGEDDRGPFVGRARTAAPIEVPVTSRWTLVAAARTGLLFAIEALAPGQRASDAAPDGESASEPPSASRARDLFWFSSQGVRRIALGHLFDGGSLRAVNTDDGGLVVLALTDDDPAPEALEAPPDPSLAEVVLAVRLGPDGVERARRLTAFERRARQLVGVGRVGASWGVVAADRTRAGHLTLLPLEGPEQELGSWTLSGAPRPCGARAPGAVTIHLVRGGDAELSEREVLSVSIGPQGDGPDFADERVVTFERAGEATCLRRVWGVQRVESYTDADHDGGEDPGDLWGAVRLNARGRGLSGVYDTGARLATATVTLVESIPFSQDI